MRVVEGEYHDQVSLLELHLQAVDSETRMVVVETNNLEKRVATLDAENVVAKEELEKVKQENEGLSIQLESVERDAVEQSCIVSEKLQHWNRFSRIVNGC